MRIALIDTTQMILYKLVKSLSAHSRHLLRVMFGAVRRSDSDRDGRPRRLSGRRRSRNTRLVLVRASPGKI
jgi:hypothetical protein